VCVLRGEQAHLETNVELGVFGLANKNNLHFVDTFDGVLTQDVRNIVVRCSHALHVIRHVEVKIFPCWILYFECLEVRIVV
jgi:hypothetical protein